MGKYQKTLGGLLEKLSHSEKKATMAKEPEWTLNLEEWGTHKEIDELDYAHKKRSALQQEIARREQATRRQRRHQQQLEIILEWRGAERYLKENQKEIQYAARRIIDLDRPQSTYRSSWGKFHSNTPIRAYTDWGNWKPIREKSIQIAKHPPIGKNTELRAHRTTQTNGNTKKTRPRWNRRQNAREMEGATTGSVAQDITTIS